MSKKVYYKYNPDTNNYERVYPSLKSRMLSIGRVVLLGFLLGALFYYIDYAYFSSPTEESLRRENARLKTQLNRFNARLDNALKVMDEIRDRDDNFYRVMMQMDPVGKGQRFAGLDNDRRYKELLKYPDSKLLVEMSRRMDILERGLYTQSVSFDNLRATAIGNKDRLAHIPSIMPISTADYTISSGYGNRIDPIYETPMFHAGLDFPADEGTAIFATADGTVSYSGWRGGYGYCVDVDHGYNYVTRYAHMSRIGVKEGQKVSRGDKLGEVGSTGKSTGPHLHYEVRFKDEPQNPVNYYFMDLTPEQYAEMIKQAENAGHVMD